MTKKMRKILAAILAANLVLNVMTVNVFAAESPTVTGTGTLEDPKVTVSESTSKDDSGNTTTTVTTTTEAAGTNTEGAAVERTETTTDTKVKDGEGTLLEESGSVAGTETAEKEKTDNVPTVTVTLKPGTEQTGTSGTGSQETTGTTKEQNPDNYNAATTTETDRKVTAGMGEAEVTTGSGEDVDIDTKLTPIRPVWNDEKQDVYAPDSNSETVTPSTPKPDGYDFLYTGDGERSRYSITYTDLNEAGEIEEGTTSATQFQLTDMSDPDAENKIVHTVYCVELGRTVKDGYWYTIDNLESKTYYKTDEAENHVRAIVNNGYWGTEEGTGSLEKLKADLKKAGQEKTGLTDDQIDSLTEGEALTATQIAIWQYANIMHGVEIPEYSNKEAKERISKVMNYLAGLSEEASETEVITKNKFIDKMSLTVGEKVAESQNNDGTMDGNQENTEAGDKYNVNLTFSLMVQPSDTKDDLIVKVISEGKVIHTARLAGSSKEGETFGKITPDAEGNYTLTGLQLVEGQDIDFNLKLEGAQYLKQGVYIFTSEERTVTDTGGNETTKSSQTQVGIAEGTRKVDVSMSVTLRFGVEEAAITTEREWGNRWIKNYRLDSSSEDPDDDEPETESKVEEKKVPNVAVPRTGDISSLWLALSVLSGGSLAGWTMIEKRCRKEQDESGENQ